MKHLVVELPNDLSRPQGAIRADENSPPNFEGVGRWAMVLLNAAGEFLESSRPFLRVMPSLGLTKVALFEQQDRMPLDQITFGLKRRGLKLVALGAIVCLAAGISLSAHAQQEPMDTRELGMMAKSQKLAALQKPSVLDECKQTLESQKKTIAALEKRVKELERELAARKAKK